MNNDIIENNKIPYTKLNNKDNDNVNDNNNKCLNFNWFNNKKKINKNKSIFKTLNSLTNQINNLDFKINNLQNEVDQKKLQLINDMKKKPTTLSSSSKSQKIIYINKLKVIKNKEETIIKYSNLSTNLSLIKDNIQQNATNISISNIYSESNNTLKEMLNDEKIKNIENIIDNCAEYIEQGNDISQILTEDISNGFFDNEELENELNNILIKEKKELIMPPMPINLITTTTTTQNNNNNNKKEKKELILTM